MKLIEEAESKGDSVGVIIVVVIVLFLVGRMFVKKPIQELCWRAKVRSVWKERFAGRPFPDTIEEAAIKLNIPPY